MYMHAIITARGYKPASEILVAIISIHGNSVGVTIQPIRGMKNYEGLPLRDDRA